MNFSHLVLVSLVGASLLATAAAGTESLVLMDEMTTTEVRDAIKSSARSTRENLSALPQVFRSDAAGSGL